MSATIPEAKDNGGAWGFPRRDAERIASVVRRIEATPLFGQPERARWPVAGGGGAVIPAKSGGATIAAGSMTSPTSADVTLLVSSGSGAGLTTTGGSTVTAYNMYTSAVNANSLIFICHFAGHYYIVAANC